MSFNFNVIHKHAYVALTIFALGQYGCTREAADNVTELGGAEGSSGAEEGMSAATMAGAQAQGGEGSIPRPLAGESVAGQGGEESQAIEPPMGIPRLGAMGHTLDDVEVVELGSESDGLNQPRALAVNPARPEELWVVNQQDDSVVVFFNYDTPDQETRKFRDPYALHFMDAPSSISFNSNGLFGTCQESVNTYDQQAPPDYFMGPSLWSSDFDVFAQSNPAAVRFLGDDLGSHLDMLHESPNCMGIAWEKENIYWVFEGETSSIARIDFREDHGPGFDDHSDGIIWRYAEGQVARFRGVASHLVFDHDSGKLYIADTGNQRIGVLDTRIGGEQLTPLEVIEPGTQLARVEDGGDVETLPGTEGLFRGPSGLALHEGVLYVSNAANGHITALDPETGEVLDWLETGINGPGLQGIHFDPQGRLYYLDTMRSKLYRVSPKE